MVVVWFIRYLYRCTFDCSLWLGVCRCNRFLVMRRIRCQLFNWIQMKTKTVSFFPKTTEKMFCFLPVVCLVHQHRFVPAIIYSVRAVPMRQQIVNAFREDLMVLTVYSDVVVGGCSMFRSPDCVRNCSVAGFDDCSIVSGDCTVLVVVWLSVVSFVRLIDCEQCRLFDFQSIDFVDRPNKIKFKQN